MAWACQGWNQIPVHPLMQYLCIFQLLDLGIVTGLLGSSYMEFCCCCICFDCILLVLGGILPLTSSPALWPSSAATSAFPTHLGSGSMSSWWFTCGHFLVLQIFVPLHCFFNNFWTTYPKNNAPKQIIVENLIALLSGYSKAWSFKKPWSYVILSEKNRNFLEFLVILVTVLFAQAFTE